MTRSDAIVRRQLLKAGLIAAGMPFCPEALFDRRAAADGETLAGHSPIGPHQILKGLDGMSRVADKRAPTPLTREYWAAQAKHRVGEIVSSHTVTYPHSFYALAKDVKVEDLKKRILAKVYRLTATN